MEAARRAIRRTRPRPSTAPRAKTARANAPLQRHHVDGFIGGNRFPLIEPAAATFVYRGEADAVYLRRWMHGETDGLPLERLDGTDFWHVRVSVPKGRPARVQVRHRARRDRRLDQRSFEPGGRHRPVRRQLGMPNLRLRDAGMEPTGPIGSGRQDRHTERAERGFRRGTPGSHLSSRQALRRIDAITC